MFINRYKDNMQFVCSIIIGVARSLITHLNKKRKNQAKEMLLLVINIMEIDGDVEMVLKTNNKPPSTVHLVPFP